MFCGILSGSSLFAKTTTFYHMSEIMPCNKNDKPLVVYRFLGNVMTSIIKALQTCNIPATGYFQYKENHFETRAITLYLFVKMYPSVIPRHYFSISTLIPSLKKIGKKMLKLESENKFLMSIKGYNSVLVYQNLPVCNPRTLLRNIDSHTKFEENQ